MFKLLWHWAIRWADSHGLGAVAGVLEKRAAHNADPQALHAVARRALADGDTQAAVLAARQALEHAPQDAGLWCTLGAAHRHALEFDAARQAYERALTLAPQSLTALSNLGEWHLACGNPQAALGYLEQALTLSPGFFEARVNRVATLFELSRYGDALQEAQELVDSEPSRPEPYVNLGNVLVHTGQAKQAVAQYRRALELRPDYAEAHYNLATLLGTQEDLKQAIGYLRAQIEARGESMHRLGMLASAHQAAGHLAEAEDLCRRIIGQQPENLSAHITLASVISNSGDSAAALPVYEKVVALDGAQAAMASNVLFELNYQPGLDRAAVFARHLQWAERYEAPQPQGAGFAAWSREPERRLRIGYVSGDFCAHPVGFLLRDILRHHDPARFEVHCFSMLLRPDDVSADIRAAATHWHDVFLVPDADFEATVRAQQIDILVDLSGHTAFHRLTALARRLAPVQASWIGYFHSTGMRQVDYFITDRHTSPADSGQLFSETAVWLPHSRFCFSPPAYATEPAPTPALAAGHITFGSFNRLAKLNDAVIAAWARILHRVAGSRLVLKAGALAEERVRQRLLGLFAAHGIDGARIELREASAHRLMLQEYGDVDIALDPFPFNGGMTTLEALWMGVPVLTLEGNTVVARQSHTALANLGLAAELSCPTLAAYEARAVELARDVPRLAALRESIRPRMAASPMCQPETFTRELEALYQRMWGAWCVGKTLPSDVQGAPAAGLATTGSASHPSELPLQPQPHAPAGAEVPA